MKTKTTWALAWAFAFGGGALIALNHGSAVAQGPRDMERRPVMATRARTLTAAQRTQILSHLLRTYYLNCRSYETTSPTEAAGLLYTHIDATDRRFVPCPIYNQIGEDWISPPTQAEERADSQALNDIYLHHADYSFDQARQTIEDAVVTAAVP